jgi:nitrate reductase NapE component
VAFISRCGDDTAEAMMDRQTKMAFAVLAVLIVFIVALALYGSFNGWYE